MPVFRLFLNLLKYILPQYAQNSFLKT